MNGNPVMIPEARRQGVSQKQLVAFCGARTSASPPSYLLDWIGFNDAILQEFKHGAFSARSDLAAVIRSEIETQRVGDIGVETLSGLNVRSLSTTFGCGNAARAQFCTA